MKFCNYVSFLLCLGASVVLAQSGAIEADSVLSGGLYRKFYTYRPASYNGTTAVPLVLNYHGYTSSAGEQMLYSNFNAVADTANLLVVYPEGTEVLGSQFWNAGLASEPDDVAFTGAMIDRLLQRYNIDFERVYSCGMSNGGIMSYYLACNLSWRIAAIASVTGTMFNAWQPGCKSGRAVPVMEIHGTADAVVPYAGNQQFTPTDSVVRHWVRRNNCNPSPATFSVPNTNNFDNSTAVNFRYTGGTNGAAVELYKVIGGSHSWPGSFPLIPATNLDFSATAEIWRFFRQYRLGQFVTSLQEPLADAPVHLYPNPATDQVQLSHWEGGQVLLTALDGTEVPLIRHEGILQVGHLPAGVYYLHLQKGAARQVLRLLKLNP